MADEDEIDVLGDFSLDSLLSTNETGIRSCYDSSPITQSSELLSCDYALNPPWLLDHTVSTPPECWYTNSTTDFNAEDCNSATNTSLGFDEVICSESKTPEEPGWSEEEKSLLERGLEIFGKSSVRLSQFIGSKTASQIKYYLKHNYSPNTNYCTPNLYYNGENVDNSQTSCNKSNIPTVFNMFDIIEDAQIPASIEEVIAAVSTAKPTINNIHKRTVIKKTNNRKYLKNTMFGQSVLKNNVFKTTKKKTKKELEKTTNTQRRRSTKKVQTKNITTPAKTELVNFIDTVKPSISVLPVSSGEELIKISKENIDNESDTEIEIDIDEKKICKPVIYPPIRCQPEEDKIEEDSKKEEISSAKQDDKLQNSEMLKNLDENVLKFLSSTDVPTEECILGENSISDVEKVIHSKFFEGRLMKTPNRYLKIRNHIIEYWMLNKPAYCTKTSVRVGLKNCGDVNCIGRVHQYLEQIGAINFGCNQTNYIRPMLTTFTLGSLSNQPKEKPKKEQIIGISQHRSDVVRARVKKKYNNDGEGGYTMMHNENGEVIDTTVINEEKQIKPRTYRKQNIKLVYCRMFTTENAAPYTINLNIAALMMIDLHAHSALIEVMGLLGGTYEPISRVLHITRYIPCRSMDHSNTHCDMCPVSQSEASESLQSEGLEVIGWFHSHPTFYPNPSLQDIDSQLNMQLYLSNEYSPFVGVILSPYRSLANTLASEYRCLIVDKHQTTKDGKGIPYKFPVNLTSEGFQVNDMLRHAKHMFLMKNNIPAELLVDFQKPYFQDNAMSYLEKFLASTKIHLARCSDINKMTCDAIVQGLTDICLGEATR